MTRICRYYSLNIDRFDAGGWWRYDDSQVNQTRWVWMKENILSPFSFASEERVLGGSGRREGYIFTYVHQPQWDVWTAGLVDSWTLFEKLFLGLNLPLSLTCIFMKIQPHSVIHMHIWKCDLKIEHFPSHLYLREILPSLQSSIMLEHIISQAIAEILPIA